jgi:EAL domain-containing protein (putative c-di-GMP-specific phosphodiesterase class I)
MSAAIGIALFPADGDSAEQILSAADAAAYAARRSGANCIRFASARFAAATRKHLALVNDIRRGLEQGEFHPFYQPIVDIDRGSVVGAEALLRWRHSERGLLLPGEFIEAAEESGLIVGLSERCLAAVHRQSREWALAGRPLRIAVNLSGRQINNGELLGMLARLEPAADAARPLLDFELTESLLLEASETAEKTLEAVKALGCGIGLDDFGTGYSSFAYLRRLPIDTIKIDRQFVAAMHNSRQAVAIIAALIALAKNLELKIVAEGVETAEQMWLLRKMGCPLQQGFHFTKALPAEDFERWMAGFGRQTLSDAPGSGMRSAVNR